MGEIPEEPQGQLDVAPAKPAWQIAVEQEAAETLARIAEHMARPNIIPEGSGPDDYQGA
jgi:hypothetical protein